MSLLISETSLFSQKLDRKPRTGERAEKKKKREDEQGGECRERRVEEKGQDKREAFAEGRVN